jgi:hypothetical protein
MTTSRIDPFMTRLRECLAKLSLSVGPGKKVLRGDMKKMCSKFAVLIFFTHVFLFGCSKANLPSWQDDQPPNIARIAGVWSVESASLSLIRSRGVPNAPTNMSIALWTNGIAMATNFPYDVGGSSSQLQLVSGRGTWSLERKGISWYINLTINYHGNELAIKKRSKVIVLTNTLDDPDSGDTIVIVKPANASKTDD